MNDTTLPGGALLRGIALSSAAWLVLLLCGSGSADLVAAEPEAKAAQAEGAGDPAEAPHGADAEHAKGGGGHEQPGPISATQNDVDLAIWSLITFVVFVAVLKKLAWGPLIEGLDKRESKVLQDIADAESSRIKAEKMLAAHAEKLDKVHEEIRELLAEARRDAEQTRAEIMATAQREAEASRQRAVQEIERARDEALSQLFSHMARCVEEATEQVVGRSLTGADHERLITEALSNVSLRKN